MALEGGEIDTVLLGDSLNNISFDSGDDKTERGQVS